MDFISKSQLGIALERIKAWINANLISDISISGITIRKTKGSTTSDAFTLPTASSSQQGVTKLYDDASHTYTDGAMTQNATVNLVENSIANKADKENDSQDIRSRYFQTRGGGFVFQSSNGGSQSSLTPDEAPAEIGIINVPVSEINDYDGEGVPNITLASREYVADVASTKADLTNASQVITAKDYIATNGTFKVKNTTDNKTLTVQPEGRFTNDGQIKLPTGDLNSGNSYMATLETKEHANASFHPLEGAYNKDLKAKNLKFTAATTGGANPIITVAPGVFNGGSDGTVTLPNKAGRLLVDENVDSALSTTSANPVQNKVINTALGNKAAKNGSSSENFSAAQLTATGLKLEGNDASIQKQHASLSTTFTYSLPNKSGTLALLDDISLKDVYRLDSRHATLNRPATDPSANTLGYIYLIPSANSQTGNTKDEFITVNSGTEASPVYSWEQIGSTETDLSAYWQNGNSSLASTYLVNANTGSASDAASSASNASLYAMLNYYFPVS